MSSIQGSNSLWNIDFSNPTSVATINKEEEQVEVSDSTFDGRGLGFMSFVYASMDNTDDGTYEANSSYVVENADFLTKYTQEDMKSFLESNSSSFNTTIDWTEYEEILTSEQIAHLSTEYSGDLSYSQFTEVMDAIEALKELNDVTGEYTAQPVNSYNLFASSMASALDSYLDYNCIVNEDMSDEDLSFLSTDYYSTETFSFADHFENMIDDLMADSYMDISGLLAVLDSLRAEETSFSMSNILDQLDYDTISGLVGFSSSIA